jgi:fructokinase
MQSAGSQYRIGVDLGGTKIAGVVLGTDDRVLAEARQPSPRHDYVGTIQAIGQVIEALEAQAADSTGSASIGIGMPGAISPRTGRVHNANSTWLNGKPLHVDLETALGRPVRLSNDANCFALSEAQDGAAAGARIVFGVILGTGCGGGIVIDGKLVDGPHGIAGEWGHTPLPWTSAIEAPGPQCWCGQHGCLETWVSGTALAADHLRVTGETLVGDEIVTRASAGDALARATLDRHADRLARGLALITNVLDPDVFVLGGGLSQMPHLYEALPRLMARHIFSDHSAPVIRQPLWGDASGVRGAARLWD